MHARRRRPPGFNPLLVILLLGGLLCAAMACVGTAQSSEPLACPAHTFLQPTEHCQRCHETLSNPLPSLESQHPPRLERSPHVSIANLMARNAAIALNPQHGHTMELTYNPPDEGDPVPFDGVFDENDAQGEVKRDGQGERIRRQALVEIPATIDVSEKGTITAYGQDWKILGIVGRDANLITWRVQLPVTNKFRKPDSKL